MIAATLTILFVFSGVFAIATIAGSVRRHGAAALAIGQALRTIGDSREVSVITRRIDVRATARVRFDGGEGTALGGTECTGVGGTPPAAP